MPLSDRGEREEKKQRQEKMLKMRKEQEEARRPWTAAAGSAPARAASALNGPSKRGSRTYPWGREDIFGSLAPDPNYIVREI